MMSSMMMSNIMMIVPFTMLVVIALFLCYIFDFDIGQGIVMSTSFVIGVLVITGKIFSSFIMGYLIIFAVTVIAMLYIFIRIIIPNKKHNKKCSDFIFDKSVIQFIVVFVGIAILFCILYYNDFIQHIDELHQWAARPKFMLEHGRIPSTGEYPGYESSIATSIFIYFFQFFTGYNEGLMYVAGVLFYWIGFLLPFGKAENRNGKTMLIYVALLYIALYSLYVHGTKNLYVDISLAAWGFGLFAWIRNCEKKKSNILFIIITEIIIYNIKNTIGLVIIVLTLGFFMVRIFASHIDEISEEKQEKEIKVFTWINGICSLGIIAVWMLINGAADSGIITYIFHEILSDMYFTPEKLINTNISFLKKFVSTPLGSLTSNLKISALFVIVASIVMIYLIGIYFDNNVQNRVYVVYLIFASVTYAFIIFLGYLIHFGESLASKAASCQRYTSIWSIIIFAYALFYLLQITVVKNEKGKSVRLIIGVLLIIFTYGLDAQYISRTTSFMPKEVSYYTEMQNMKGQIAEMQNIIKKGEKVYLINQSPTIEEADIINSLAVYYMNTQVSNYLYEPHMYGENGCQVRLTQEASPTIRNIAQTIKNGEYSYVWIYKTDSFLNRLLPTFLGEKDYLKTTDSSGLEEEEMIPEHLRKPNMLVSQNGLHNGQLYKIIYKNDVPYQLTLVNNLQKYDIREGSE